MLFTIDKFSCFNESIGQAGRAGPGRAETLYMHGPSEKKVVRFPSLDSNHADKLSITLP